MIGPSDRETRRVFGCALAIVVLVSAGAGALFAVLFLRAGGW